MMMMMMVTRGSSPRPTPYYVVSCDPGPRCALGVTLAHTHTHAQESLYHPPSALSTPMRERGRERMRKREDMLIEQREDY